MFSISELGVEFRGRRLFSGVSLQLGRGERYGLVGANGSGKTTFFRVLSGGLEPSSGSATLPAGTQLGMLKQDTIAYEEIAIRDVVMMGKRVLWDALVAKEELLGREMVGEREAEHLAELEVVIAREGGYEAESRVASFVEGLGMPEEMLSKPLKVLSSGYRLRVMLAQLLFGEPDVLLLDEPTNYLDIVSIAWLERYLKGYAGTCILSSHDRTFLNRVATAIIDVDYETLRIYPGNFDDFWEKKLDEVEQKSAQMGTIDRRQREIQRFIDKNRAKASKARQARSKGHIIRKLEKEREGLTQAPSSRQYPNFAFRACRKPGAMVLKVDGVSKSFGKKRVLSDVSFSIEKGEKVAIVGPNGIGKSTLLEIVMGAAKADSGSVAWGHHTYPGYFPQNIERFMDKGEMALSWLEGQGVKECRGLLGQMLLSGDDAEKKVGALSGGERARLFFAKLMGEESNVLVFDEPTNHLDMESTEALADALSSYDGTLLLVSHDRHFIGEVATRILEVSHEGVYDFIGSYEEYAKRREDDPLTPQVARKKREKKTRKKSQLPQIEKECQMAEMALEKVREKLADPALYCDGISNEVSTLEKEQQRLQNDVEMLYKKWEEISDLESED